MKEPALPIMYYVFLLLSSRSNILSEKKLRMFASLLVVCCQTNKIEGLFSRKVLGSVLQKAGQADPSLLGANHPHQPQAGADRQATNYLDD